MSGLFGGGGSGSLMTMIGLLKQAFSTGTRSFESAIAKFNLVAERLQNTTLQVSLNTQKDMTLTLGTSEFIAGLRDELKRELSEKIKYELSNATFDESGNLVPTQSSTYA